MVPATAQFIYQAHDLDKPEMIGRLLQAEGADLMIVFTRTKRQAQRIADDLDRARLQRQPAARRHGPGGAREGADQVPRGQAPGARRHRRRRPRHRRHRRHPRHQLHLPRGREDLRPPDRPHRPRRRHRHRDHLRRLGRPAPLEDDQQGARPALRRAAGDLLQLRALPARPGHRPRHQGPRRSPRARSSSSASRRRPRPRRAAVAAAVVRWTGGSSGRGRGPRPLLAAGPAAGGQSAPQSRRGARRRRPRRASATAAAGAPAAAAAATSRRRPTS